MLVINSIEKSRLHGDSFSYSGSGVAWKARFVLFLGFALLAGGLAGSVVSPSPARGCFGANGPDCHGAQVPGQELSAADALLRDCEYHREWVGYAEVCFLVLWLVGRY